jgi:hypothetical protein
MSQPREQNWPKGSFCFECEADGRAVGAPMEADSASDDFSVFEVLNLHGAVAEFRKDRFVMLT